MNMAQQNKMAQALREHRVEWDHRSTGSGCPFAHRMRIFDYCKCCDFLFPRRGSRCPCATHKPSYVVRKARRFTKEILS